MAKFPDSSKSYSAAPLGSSIDSSQLAKENTVYAQPAPPQAPPITPPPVISDLPHQPAPRGEGGRVSSSPLRNLIPLLIGITALLLLGFLVLKVVPRFLGKVSQKSTTLVYWGLWEPPSVMETVLADYERETGVKVEYKPQSIKGYRSRLQSAVVEGGGPDIVRIHNTWLPMLSKILSPAPADLGLSLSDYYPVVAKDFAQGSSIYALPLEVDGLALYYNEDILKEAGAEVPTDWNALRKLAFELTKRNEVTGVVERAGVALGTANNIDNWSDILGLLILQNAGNPGKPSEQAVQDALTFYTIFATTDKSWDVSQPQSTLAFASGKVAMILAPSWRAADIKVLNPDLHFGIAKAPSLPTTDLAWATYWAEAVPVSSKHQQAAWQFIKYLSSPEVLQKLYASEAALRPVGEPYPQISLASSLASDPLAAPFVAQAPHYTSWYLASNTFDEGVNDQLIKYYEDAVNAVVSGSTVSSVTKTLDAGVTQVLAKYPSIK